MFVWSIYRGQELNQIVTVHPWDTAVELVILNRLPLRLDSWYQSFTVPGFQRMTTGVGVATDWKLLWQPTSAVSWWKNAILTLKASLMIRLQLTVAEKLGDLPCSGRNFHSYPFDWRTTANHLAGSTTVVCICFKFRQEILDEIDKVKFHSEMGKVRLTIWFRPWWQYSRQRASEFNFQSSMPNTNLATAETIEHVVRFLRSTVFIVWWKCEAKALLP